MTYDHTIRKNLVSLADKLEVRRSFLFHVRLHLVGMEEECLFAIGLLDVFLGGIWADAEYFVEVGLVVVGGHLLGLAGAVWVSVVGWLWLSPNTEHSEQQKQTPEDSER